MTEITILAVTRLSDGVCVAGITDDGDWVRPTRPNAADSWRQLEYDDCRNKNGGWVVCRGNRAKMGLVEPIPKDAHCEDWLVGKNKPELLRELAEQEYADLCEEHCECSLKPLEEDSATRSLALIQPDEICTFYFGPDNRAPNKYIPRCTFRLGSATYQNIGVTDAEWRGFGRTITRENHGACTLRAEQLFQRLGTTTCYLSIGRYEVNSTIYFLVIGVHLFPVRHFEMDFNRG